MDRVLPWGELCRKFETRLKDAGLREAWRQLARRMIYDGVETQDAHIEAAVFFKEALDRGEPELSVDDESFVMKAREGLMLDLPLRAGVDRELDWVGANMYRSYPNIQRAPSL